jgi:hypothetical protein
MAEWILAESGALVILELVRSLEIGARGFWARCISVLACCTRERGRADQAKKCISGALQLFEEHEAGVYLGKAKDALTTLG